MTGTVPEVRPYLAHAGVVVVPMRLARGIQNKALEAMAMGAPTIVSTTSAAALNAVPSRDFRLADDAESFAREVVELFADRAARRRLGDAGRATILANYDWSRNLARIERCFDSGFDRSVDQLFEIPPRSGEPEAQGAHAKRRPPPGPFLGTDIEHA